MINEYFEWRLINDKKEIIGNIPYPIPTEILMKYLKENNNKFNEKTFYQFIKKIYLGEAKLSA